jgi:hypothetical protein
MSGNKPQKTQEEIEMEQMAQAELARLQRQFRIMEEDRANYAEETKIVLNRQRLCYNLLVWFIIKSICVKIY